MLEYFYSKKMLIKLHKIFYVTLKNKGMAELTPEEKSRISHRAIALNNVLMWLKYSKEWKIEN